MIDAATQILSTVKTSGNNARKSDAGKEDSNSSFTTVYDRSKSEVEKNKPERSELSKKDKEPTSTSRTSKDISNSDNKKKEDGVTKKPNETSTSRIKNNDNDVEAKERIEASSDKSDKEKIESVTSIIDLIETEANDENPISSDIVPSIESLSENDKETVDLALLENSNHKPIDIQQSEDKLGEVANAIIQEVKASIENVDKTKGSEETNKLSRAQILENIKNVLDQDLYTDLNIPAQLLKPDLSLNINASKVLSEQLNLKNFNLNAEIKNEPESELALEGDISEDIDDTRDELLKKIMDKLDFNKVKNGVASDVKAQNIISDKASISDFVEQLAPKLNTETTGSTLFSSASGILSRTGTLPALQQFTLNTQLNQPNWGAEFSKRINFMVSNDIKQAELRLDPPELGRINVKIVVSQDQASVVFTSAHGNVREAIENSLPRLRELLQESGIQLSDANVNEQQQEKTNQSEDGSQLSGPVIPEMEAEDLSLEENENIQHSVDGLIDYFA